MSEEAVDNGPCIRLLQCFDCKSMDVIPDFVGNPEDDVTLHYTDEKHGGHTQQPHTRALHRIPQKFWDNDKLKKQIVDGMWEDVTGFTPDYYAARDNLKEDATKCFVAHHRAIPCIDWHEDSKRLRAPTGELRRQLAKDIPRNLHHIDRDRLAKGAPVQFLCDYCPVKIAVDRRKREERGLV